MSRILKKILVVVLLLGIPPLAVEANGKAEGDSSAAGVDSSRAHSPTQVDTLKALLKLHHYSLRKNEIVRSIWPIIDLRLSYPYLLSLETGVIYNLTASEETYTYDPINGPAVFIELGYPGAMAGLGANFGKETESKLTFVRPEICYSKLWTNRLGLRNRSQYLGTGVTGSFRLFKVSFRILHQVHVYYYHGYLLYFGVGFGI
jgi:hypothetical protein